MRRETAITTALAWLGAALLAGCLGPRLHRHAETPWVEVRSNAFRVLAQGDLETARTLCNDAEALRAVIARVTNARRADLRVPTTIFVFERIETVTEFADRRLAGLALPGLRDNAALIFSGQHRTLTGREVLFHEYTHLVLHSENQTLYPMWYDEGLAGFFSSVRVQDDRVFIGLMPKDYENTARWAKRLPIESVVTARSYDGWAPEKIAAYYMQSWLLTHYLSQGLPPPPAGQPSPLSRYLARNAAPEASEQAWREEFGMDFAELDDRLQAYSKKVPGGAIPLASLSVASCGETRTLAAAEIAQELGWLAVRLGRREEAGPLFEASLRADPNDARAHAGLGDVAKFQGRWADAPPHYARALELAPNDYQNHLELAEFALALPPEHGGGPKQVALAREHLATALRLSPDNPEAWYVLAQSYLAPGEDPKLGIPHAQRAALLLPSNENVQLLLAQVYLAAGETDAARGRLTRLMAWSHAKVADQAARLLAVLETREESAAGDGHLPDADGGSGGGPQP